MRLSIRWKVKGIRFSLRIGRVSQVTGINSTLKDNSHIIMWEFDETDWRLVKRWLWASQAFHSLPAIYVSRSHPGGGFHAYCFQRVNWIDSIAIVAKTEGVDPGYISMCCQRGHWTLRLTDKGKGTPQYLTTLPSGHPETASKNDLLSVVQYESWRSDNVIKIGK